MAKVSESQRVQPSVLDRLIESADRGPGTPYSVRDLKQAVRSDLENLLNTRWRCKSWPPDLKNLDRSLVNYGIPDFTGANLGSGATREEFRKVLQRSIEMFEPRLAKVQVKVAMAPNPTDRTIRFQINAVLRADPIDEPVRFETSLDPSTAAFNVKRIER